MTYQVDLENKLREARKRSRFGDVASLTRKGVGNDMAKKQKAAMKPARKKAAAKKAAPAKTAAPAKKTAAKKTTKKS